MNVRKHTNSDKAKLYAARLAASFVVLLWVAAYGSTNGGTGPSPHGHGGTTVTGSPTPTGGGGGGGSPSPTPGSGGGDGGNPPTGGDGGGPSPSPGSGPSPGPGPDPTPSPSPCHRASASAAYTPQINIDTISSSIANLYSTVTNGNSAYGNLSNTQKDKVQQAVTSAFNSATSLVVPKTWAGSALYCPSSDSWSAPKVDPAAPYLESLGGSVKGGVPEVANVTVTTSATAKFTADNAYFPNQPPTGPSTTVAAPIDYEITLELEIEVMVGPGDSNGVSGKGSLVIPGTSPSIFSVTVSSSSGD